MANERGGRGEIRDRRKFEREIERERIEIFFDILFFTRYFSAERGGYFFFTAFSRSACKAFTEAFHGSPSWTAWRYGTDYANVDYSR